MSGRPGRSGRRAKPVTDHLLRGTFRNDRHGALVATSTLPMATTTDEVSVKTAARIGRGLGQSGRRLVREMLRGHEGWSVIDLEVLRRAGRTLDRVEALDEAIGVEVIIVGKRGATTVNALVAEQRAETRQFTALIRQLDLKLED